MPLGCCSDGATLVAMTVINYLGIRWAAFVQTLVTGLIIVAGIVLISGAALHGDAANAEPLVATKRNHLRLNLPVGQIVGGLD